MPRTPEGDVAWAKVNAVLDANGNQDTAEYREAWAEWERLTTQPTEPEPER